MSAGLAFLVGGPRDGEQLMVEERTAVIKVSLQPRINMMDQGKLTPPHLETRVINYVPKYIDMFGVMVRVHVAENTPVERIEATAATYFITDLAKELAEE